MVLSKPTSGTEILTTASLTANTQSSASSEVDTSNAVQLSIEVNGTFNASAVTTALYTLEVYGGMATGVYSTEPFAVRNLVVRPNTTSQQIFGLPCPMRYIMVKLYNHDAQAFGTVSIKAAMQTLA